MPLPSSTPSASRNAVFCESLSRLDRRCASPMFFASSSILCLTSSSCSSNAAAAGDSASSLGASSPAGACRASKSTETASPAASRSSMLSLWRRGARTARRASPYPPAVTRSRGSVVSRRDQARTAAAATCGEAPLGEPADMCVSRNAIASEASRAESAATNTISAREVRAAARQAADFPPEAAFRRRSPLSSRILNDSSPQPRLMTRRPRHQAAVSCSLAPPRRMELANRVDSVSWFCSTSSQLEYV
mmetsp:Transcript_41626/g.98692  ORF Transcript_41626/g.98692 Transcript_41626/m.98692 type:complete len:248 (+) Transcript_41626:455-1198(+)